MTSTMRFPHDIDNLVNKVTSLNIEQTQATFFDLPLEIRQQIYNHVVPVCRLAPFPYLDPEWQMNTTEYRGIPQLMFASKQLYNEVFPLVYSKAILEIAPAQQGYPIFHTKNSSTKQIVPYSYTRLSSMFRFYPSHHLKLIRQVHIFSNQADVIDGQSYEILLQWLIVHTSATDINLSSRPMTRIRGKITFDLPSWRAMFYDNPSLKQPLRIIRIWTKAKRPPWEYEKIMRLRCNGADGTLSPMQVYFWSSAGDETNMQQNLQLDPRWSTRHNDDGEKIEMLNQALPLIDEVLLRTLDGQERADHRSASRHFNGESWVYQMILVSEAIRLVSTGVETTETHLPR